MGIFGSRSAKKKQKAYESKRAEAMQAQRQGDIQGFAELSQQAEKLLRELQATQQQQ